MNIFERKLAEQKAGIKHPPKQHPLLKPEYTRVFLIDVQASTDKAALLQLEEWTGWVPNSCHVIQWGSVGDDTLKNVVDIQNWFYDKNIGK